LSALKINPLDNIGEQKQFERKYSSGRTRKVSDLNSPTQNQKKPFPMKIDKEEMAASTSVPIFSNLVKKEIHYDAYDDHANLTENAPKFPEASETDEPFKALKRDRTLSAH
jgi:hypothetical protein